MLPTSTNSVDVTADLHSRQCILLGRCEVMFIQYIQIHYIALAYLNGDTELLERKIRNIWLLYTYNHYIITLTCTIKKRINGKREFEIYTKFVHMTTPLKHSSAQLEESNTEHFLNTL